MHLTELIQKEVKSLFPGYFALVMGTGLIGICAGTFELTTLSNLFFYLNNISYLILLILFINRLFSFYGDFKNDLSSHEKSDGFFTIVAGSGVLGIQYSLLKHIYLPAAFLWFFAIAVWLILTVVIFYSIITKLEKPSLEKGINGIWLLIIVSTQSLSILGNQLVFYLVETLPSILFFNMLFYFLGCSLYFIIITLIFYRLVFFPVNENEVTHPYWINAGAAAISTLAGINLIEKCTAMNYFENFIPFIQGLNILMWTIGTWWIPMVVMLEVWRYVIKKVKWHYDPRQWSMVFAIANYSLSTFKLPELVNVNIIKPWAIVFFCLSLLIWIFSLLSMLIGIVKDFRFTNRSAIA